ncbi:hypothetical protein MHTCC0001_26560 [Flavobacteriaceae bacterium MHTCC 0001]
MKIFFYLICSVFIFNSYFIYSQNKDDECKYKQSLFHEYVKAKKYEDAYESWLYVKDNCPKLSIAIYSDGEKILKHFISKSEGVIKKQFVLGLVDLWDKRLSYFPSKSPFGAYKTKSCQLEFDHKALIGKSGSDLSQCFNTAFTKDRTSFRNPKSLYTYFSLAVDLFHNRKKSLQEVFDVYDDINEKIEEEEKNYTQKLNVLVNKENSGKALSGRDLKLKNSHESYLLNYDLISKSIEAKIGEIADCKNLIPFYIDKFEDHKTDVIWLKRAVNRMYHKQCTDNVLYENLVKAYDNVAASADTKYFVATVLIKKGKFKEAAIYLKQAFDLETNNIKKAKYAESYGKLLFKMGNYPKARVYLRKALQLNPSNGNPYLIIAHMYKDSAKHCGNDNFKQRAIYWLAALEALKASKVDKRLKNEASNYAARYEALAPTREEIFKCGCAGEVIKIGCWINDSVIVPEIKLQKS